MTGGKKISPLRKTPATLPGRSGRIQIIKTICPAIILMFAMGVAGGLVVGAMLADLAGLPIGVISTIGAIAGVVILALLWLYVRHAEEVIDNLDKGIAGETAVAEALNELRADGYEIFHDLPWDNRKDPTKEDCPNIDHVIIGPGGVFAIETKHRSKGEGEEIIFDGEKLTIGGYEINEGAVGQTPGNARRIGEILSEVTGRRVISQPVLVFAGRWFISPRPDAQQGNLRVMNDKMLIDWVRSQRPKLSREDVALYATRLREYAHIARET